MGLSKFDRCFGMANDRRVATREHGMATSRVKAGSNEESGIRNIEQRTKSDTESIVKAER